MPLEHHFVMQIPETKDLMWMWMPRGKDSYSFNFSDVSFKEKRSTLKKKHLSMTKFNNERLITKLSRVISSKEK